MKIRYAIVGCEESQAVCIELRKLGIIAFSCDTEPCSGGHPEWHIQGDIFDYLDLNPWNNYCGWDLGIFHPPCTYLCNSGVCWLEKQKGRKHKMVMGALFFRELLQCDIKYIAVENPIMHKYAVEIIGRRQDQVIQPWMFGHGETKATCLWLKNLPKLKPTNIVKGREQRLHKLPPSKDRAMLRSKTYPGIAKAMAEQWGAHVGKGNILRRE